MKKLTHLLTLVTCFALLHSASMAQDESPVTSLNKINQAMSKISEKYLAYMSAVAHSNNKAKKAEKKRDSFLEQISQSRYDITNVPYYKGDKSLHESALSYLKLTSDVMNENYAKVVNLEKAQTLGVPTVNIGRAVRMSVAGLPVGNFTNPDAVTP